MKREKMQWFKPLLLGASLGLMAGAAQANDVQGEVEKMDAQAGTLTVQGIEFTTNEQTRYDDGFKRFEDIEVGQRVEVDFEYRDGRHIATEVEKDS